MQADSSQILRLEAFSKDLIKQQALNRLWISQDLQQVLLPLLTQANKWLDPQSFENDVEFQRAYNVMWARAKAFEELTTLLSGSEGRMRDLQKRIEQEKLKHG